MKPRLALLFAAALQTACASLPPAALSPRDAIRDFALEGRFALRVTQTGQPPQNTGGRLSWSHQNDNNRVLLSSPLGYGLAEIETSPGLSTLRTADGKTVTSDDPDALIEEVTGQRLPVRRMPAWLLGRPDKDGHLEHDPFGRPTRLTEDGWQIDYSFEDDTPSALPSRLTLTRDGEIELRLRIEEWKDTP